MATARAQPRRICFLTPEEQILRCAQDDNARTFVFRITDLPALNACLNATSALFLLLGYRAIRRLEIERHRRLMIAAAITSALFLVSYLT